MLKRVVNIISVQRVSTHSDEIFTHKVTRNKQLKERNKEREQRKASNGKLSGKLFKP